MTVIARAKPHMIKLHSSTLCAPFEKTGCLWSMCILGTAGLKQL